MRVERRLRISSVLFGEVAAAPANRPERPGGVDPLCRAIEGFIVHQDDEVKVTLSCEHLQVVRKSIESGEFANLSEAIQDGVETWKRCRIEDIDRKNALNELVLNAAELYSASPKTALREDKSPDVTDPVVVIYRDE